MRNVLGHSKLIFKYTVRTDTPRGLHFSRVPMRMPTASERLPSQRAPREERDEDTKATELQRPLRSGLVHTGIQRAPGGVDKTGKREVERPC